MSEINYTTSRLSKKKLIFEGKKFIERNPENNERWNTHRKLGLYSLTMVDGEIVKSSTLKVTHKCTETKPARTDVDLIKFKLRVSKISF